MSGAIPPPGEEAKGNSVSVQTLVEIANRLEKSHKLRQTKSEKAQKGTNEASSRVSVASEPGTGLSKIQLERLQTYLKEVNNVEVQSLNDQNKSKQTNSEKNYSQKNTNASGWQRNQGGYQKNRGYNKGYQRSWKPNHTNTSKPNTAEPKQTQKWEKEQPAAKNANSLKQNSNGIFGSSFSLNPNGQSMQFNNSEWQNKAENMVVQVATSNSDRIIGTCLINKVLTKYLCDEGADRTIINKKTYASIGSKSKLVKFEGHIKSCSGALKVFGKATLAELIVDMSCVLHNIEVLVADHQSSNDVLLGRDMCKIPKLKEALELKRKLVKNMSEQVEQMHLEETITAVSSSDNALMDEISVDKWLVRLVGTSEINVVSVEELAEKVEELIDSVAAKSLQDLTPSNTNKCHSIELVNKNEKPFRQKMRPIPHSQKEPFRKVIDEQLRAKLIRKSNSPYRSPINLVRKPDGSIRVTHDYRWLNSISVKNAYPLPIIDEILSKFAKAKIFTKIDCFSGFYQIKMEINSCQYTAFACEFGLFEYVVMPMGLTNAPATFQEVMNEVLENEIRAGFVQVYLDDIVIFSTEIDEHLVHVEQVIERLKAHTIKVKKAKCEWAKLKIKFLGHVIEHDAISPDPDKIAILYAYEKPVTLAQLWSFMGLANYNRKFIENYASLAQPLYDLQEVKDLDNSLKKKNGGIKGTKIFLKWSVEATEAFDAIRSALGSNSVLIMPDFDKEFILCTDASNSGYGAVLCQERGKDLRPIGYYSKTMSKAQKNYAVIEKELLAVVMGIEHYHKITTKSIAK
jgi:hypothetical protein